MSGLRFNWIFFIFLFIVERKIFPLFHVAAMGEKVLVLGNGGREHTLAWKLAQSATIAQVFVAPGNAGTQAVPKVLNTSKCRLID